MIHGNKIDGQRIQETLDALRNALALLQELSAQEQMRVFFANLFRLPSAQNLSQLHAALKNWSDGDAVSTGAVNQLVSTIAGTPIMLSNGQIGALKDFFMGVYYTPIMPVNSGNGSHDASFQEFYQNLFSTDADLTDVKDLQKRVGDFWTNGTPQREQAILDYLKTLGPHVAWDGRHVFSLISLLTVDAQMKTLEPYATSGSIW